MHEQGIISQVIDRAMHAGATRKIIVEVGELCTITPLHLQEHLAAVVNWEVETIYRPAKVSCSCGYEGRAAIIDKGHGYCLFNCPECGEKPKVLEGGEIKIIEVE